MFEGAGLSLWKEGWQKGFQEGFIIGFREGFREGLQKGREQARLETIRNISAQLNMSSAQVMDVLRIPPKERRRLQAKFGYPETKGKG